MSEELNNDIAPIINTGVVFLDSVMKAGIPQGHIYGLAGTGKIALPHYDELERLSLERIKMALDLRPSPSDFRPVIIDHSPMVGEPPLNKLIDEVIAKFSEITAKRFLNIKLSNFGEGKKDKNDK